MSVTHFLIGFFIWKSACVAVKKLLLQLLKTPNVLVGIAFINSIKNDLQQWSVAPRSAMGYTTEVYCNSETLFFIKLYGGYR